MYKKKSAGRRDQMRRQYNPPPTYGGSRFIRATHGVRGLEDNELASQGDKRNAQTSWDQRHVSSRDGRHGMQGGEALLPDFEYYGNVLSDGSSDSDGYTGQIAESEQSRDQRRMADEEYRDSPAPVDRFGHDFNMSSFSSPYIFGDDGGRNMPEESAWDGPNGGPLYGCEDGMCKDHNGREGDSEDPENTEGAGKVSGANRMRRPVRRERPLRSGPIRGRRSRRTPVPVDGDSCEIGSVLDAEQTPHPLLNFSLEEGDLLLLVLLALLAGEEGCADLVATFALLLMIR